MVPDLDTTIEGIRRESRALVRELGFLERSIGDTGLTPSAVHAIIEIGAERGLTAGALARRLVLEKSTISRLVGSLVKKGLVEEGANARDGRKKPLRLSAAGKRMLARIDRHGRGKVEAALSIGGAESGPAIEKGLALYAGALHLHRANGSPPAQGTGPEVLRGYAPGLIGRMVELQIGHYAREVGFGRAFEATVARDMAEFLTRLGNAQNETWRVERGGRILGGVSIDGERLGPGTGQLRWLYVDTALRGAGLGNRLMEAAMGFVRDRGFNEVHLWTFDGLDEARALYERHGFGLAEETPDSTRWGRAVTEQKFVWRR